jgi:hypothetical protein
MLKIKEYQDYFLTHPLVPSGPIPTAQDPDGVYPYESYCETSKRPVLKKYTFIAMENDHIGVVVCPDLGGKVFSLKEKRSGKDILYSPDIVRPVRILPRMAFISGGIEVSFPISHSPVQIEPVHFKTEKSGDRIYAWCGERELRFGMQWTVEYSLGPEDAFLTQRLSVHNPTCQGHPWMSWSDAAVLAQADTQFHFPDSTVLRHSNELEEIQWSQEGPKTQADIKGMTGYFWRNPDVHAFGVYTPSLQCGLYHVADPRLTPGMKLWSYGVGKHEPWSYSASRARDCFLEIQAGPFADQSIKSDLQPGQSQGSMEFWIPSLLPLDINKISLPRVELKPADAIPLFDWPPRPTVDVWVNLLDCYKRTDTGSLTDLPGLESNNWAPSGMEDLDLALTWAGSNAKSRSRDLYQFHSGCWYAGKDEVDRALEILTDCRDDRAGALAGRLYRRCKNDAQKAVDCFQKIVAPEIALHPQVVVERDLALALLGPDSFNEREKWLERVGALEDEMLLERKAALLIDQGRFDEAKSVLESTPFQLVHQRYSRSRLWKEIASHNQSIPPEIPPQLGEDDLAEFGAYREYPED